MGKYGEKLCQILYNEDQERIDRNGYSDQSHLLRSFKNYQRRVYSILSPDINVFYV